MGLTHMPRASPSHLVFKFACATQQLLDLIPEIDKKELSEKHRERLRARVDDIANNLWPKDSSDDTTSSLKEIAESNTPQVAEVLWGSDAKRTDKSAGAPDPIIAEAEGIASSALKTARAKIQQLEAEVAKMQTEPLLSTVPVNHFRLSKNDDETVYSYETLFADYARGSSSVTISEPYVERPHQVTNVDAFIRCITSAEPRLNSITLITLPGKTEAVQSYLAQVIRTWATKGVHVYVQLDEDVHARYINFSTGLRVRGDRCLDIYRRPPKKGMPRSCLPTEIFIERIRPDNGSSRSIAAGGAKPRSDRTKRDTARKRAEATPAKRSPVKHSQTRTIREDPSPLQIWRARQAVLPDSTDEDEDMDIQDSIIERERASMMREHASALAREEYEYLHDGNGMTNEQIKREAQNLAVWDLQGQHFFGRRFDARRVGNMYEDGAVHYHPLSGDEQIIRPANPYVFRVSDGYHELFINHYYDGADYVSDNDMEGASLADRSAESAQDSTDRE